MTWLLVALTVDMVGVGGLAAYWTLGARHRGRTQGHAVQAIGSSRLPVWGPDMECGIVAVDGQGHVIGTVRVPAPSLN
jgi:hypothetical protein